MRLSNAKRLRAVELFNSSQFSDNKNKREVVAKLLAQENIFISGRGLWNLVVKYRRTASVATLKSVTRDVRNTKVTHQQLNMIERLLRQDRELSARLIKQQFGLPFTERTVLLALRISRWPPEIRIFKMNPIGCQEKR